MLSRLRRNEEGFALVTAMAILAVMTLLMVVTLTAGNSAFEISEKGARFTRTLGPAEAGANDAITRLGQNRTSTSSCAIGSAFVCRGGGGEYQVDWTGDDSGTVVVTSVGYLPTMSGAQVTRKVQVTLQPEPKFEYALFSSDTLEVKNNQVIVGDIFANSAITIGTNAVICGSVRNSSGGVDTQNGAQILKSYGTCTGKDGDVWAGGTIDLHSTGYIEGDATASAPATITCPPTPSTDYAITGGTVGGAAVACGTITATAGTSTPNTRTDPPAQQTLPAYTFDAANYPGMTCFAISPSTCSDDASNHSATAASQFNSTVSKTNMQGTYVIWQQNPSQSTIVSLEDMSMAGDLTIVTNAPVTFGNTNSIDTSTPATLVVVSLYVPPTGTTCSSLGGDCSIYAANSVTFDDEISLLLYTTGKMGWKNTAASRSSGDGAVYAGSMSMQNGFDIEYDAAVERIVGFGTSLVVTLWQELAV